MSQPLHVLIVEDSEDDTLLLLRELRRGGYDPLHERVEDAVTMQMALARHSWDIVIADYSMPHFSGPAALALLKGSGLDLPFIIVSGTVGEEAAVAAMKAGAHDYLIKGNLARLIPAIERELREAKTRRQGQQAKEELRQTAAELRFLNDLVEQTTQLMTIADFQGHLIRFNRAFEQFMGYSGQELLQMTYQQLTPERWHAMEAQQLAHLMATGQAVRYEKEYRRKDGTLVPVELVTDIYRNVAGQPEYVYGFVTDITERKQAEAEIRRRNRELALFNEIIAASAAGLEPEAILEIACRELALAFDIARVTAALLNEVKTEAVVVAEYLVAGASGRQNKNLPSTRGHTYSITTTPGLQYLLRHKTPLVVANTQNDPRLAQFRKLIYQRKVVSFLMLPLLIEGQVLGALTLETAEPRAFSTEEVNLAWSVADQIAGGLARARLRQTRERLSTAIEQAAESVVITDAGGTILYVNPAFEHTSGYSRAEAIGQNPRILKSGQQDQAFYDNLWATISAGHTWQGYLINKKKDGTLFTEDATIAPVRNESGAIVNYVAVKRDVTREVQLEEQYRQAQKMEAIGRLAGGVAHDFNNLLVVIMGYSDLLLQRHFKENDPGRKYIEEIKKAGARAAGLTRQLLAFGRQQVLQPQILNFNELVATMEKMLRRLIGEDIEVVTRLEQGLGQVRVDPSQVEQILMNLVINARDAMPGGGKLLIETANVELDETYVSQPPGVKPGHYVMLAVSDSGVGMDAATQARIFEPFFTTKGPGQGTGLGLATVYGIVKQSGGDIWVYSEPGQGSTFKIYLPRVDEPVPTIEAQPLVSKLPTGTERVLLVEDEESVRVLARQILEMSGYTVLEASHGGEALLLCEQEPGVLELLVTDVVMPGGLNGRELAERLRQLYPALKVLYISGYTNNVIIHNGVLEAGMHFLQKPFTPGALAQKVRQVLDLPSPQ